MFLACVCPIECENSDNIAGSEHESHILYGFCCNFSTLSSILNLMYGVPTPSWPRASKHNVRYCFWRSPFPDLSLPEKQLFVFCPYHFNFLPPFPQTTAPLSEHWLSGTYRQLCCPIARLFCTENTIADLFCCPKPLSVSALETSNLPIWFPTTARLTRKEQVSPLTFASI